MAGQDRAAVDEDRGHVEADHGQHHGIDIEAMRGARSTFRHVTARQPRLDVGLGRHREPVSPAFSLSTRETVRFPSPSLAPWPSAYEAMISCRGVAKKRRLQQW